MNREMTSIDIDKVIFREPLRDDPGDLSPLEKSIKKLGLLHPVIIDRRNVLIVGGRRFQACRNLGLRTIPAIRVETDYGSMESLDIQADENICRRPLSPEELESHIRRKRSALGASETPASMLGSIKRLFTGGKTKMGAGHGAGF